MQVTVEKRMGGCYLRYSLPVISYDVNLAANRCMEWYVAYLNKKLDRRRYVYLLTHKECFLHVRIWQSEEEHEEEKKRILTRAQAEIDQCRENFLMLAEGKVPAQLQWMMAQEYDGLVREWHGRGK